MICIVCKGDQAVITCSPCDGGLCLKCARSHFQDQSHLNQSFYFCQQCEEEKANKYCYSCDQHLCAGCNGRIHNKGKRGQHRIQEVAGCEKFLIAYLVIVLQDATPNPEDIEDFFLSLGDKLGTASRKQEPKKHNIHLIWENTAITPVGFSHVIANYDSISDEFLKEYGKYFPMVQKVLVIDSHQSRQLKLKLESDLEYIQVTGEESRTNISMSTENQSINKGRKPPIAYYQFYRLPKDHKKSEVEIYMRRLASQGQLLVKQKDIFPIEGVIRSFIRTVGQLEVQYCSLDISNLSVESLIWVIRSIKVDRMTPGQKLILSRVKECFDIKVNSKLWQSILAYLSSKKYFQDYERMASGNTLPKILLSKTNDQYILTLKNQEWAFQDQQKFDQEQLSWSHFVKFLMDHFQTNKTIPGGRYGCVQFARMLGPKSLETCSLGRLSLYVQEAINKGIIRYHKTLLIKNVVEEYQSFTNESSSFLECDYSFSLNDKELYILQRNIKVKTIQVAMLGILYESSEPQISLAQIPLSLKKAVPFTFNLPDLGFPKLKNLILTLSDIVKMDINKSNLNFNLNPDHESLFLIQKQQLQMLLSEYIRMVVQVLSRIVRYFNLLTVDQLNSQLNTKLGFEFEYRLYNAPDFCNFLYYYCRDIVSVQFVSGTYMAYSVQPVIPKHKPKPQTSTPNFCNNSFQVSTKPFPCKLPDYFYNWTDDKKQDYVEDDTPEDAYITQNLKLVEDLLNEDDGDKISHTTYKTFIENQNIVNNLDWSISKVIIKPQEVSITNKNIHTKALSQDFDANKKITKRHNRHVSTLSTVQCIGSNKEEAELDD